MRTLLAALLLASTAAAASCPTAPPPPATPTWDYYDEADRAVWDAAALAIVAGTGADQQAANNVGYVLVQVRRNLFLAPPHLGTPVSSTAWTDDDRAFFTAVAVAVLEGAGARTVRGDLYGEATITKAFVNARLVMDFRKTRLCS